MIRKREELGVSFFEGNIYIYRESVFCEKKLNFWWFLKQRDLIECIIFFVDKCYLVKIKSAFPRFSTFFTVLEINRKTKIPGLYKRTNFVFQISQNLQITFKIAVMCFKDIPTTIHLRRIWHIRRYDLELDLVKNFDCFLQNNWFLCNSKQFRQN